MLYRSTDRLSRRGAPMENLAHSASFQSLDKDAPSKAETKHLGPPAKPVSGQNGLQFTCAFDPVKIKAVPITRLGMMMIPSPFSDQIAQYSAPATRIESASHIIT